ncbi:MAG: hypothetical protein ACI4KO_05480, partial [Ruminiclostridium sp.]
MVTGSDKTPDGDYFRHILSFLVVLGIENPGFTVVKSGLCIAYASMKDNFKLSEENGMKKYKSLEEFLNIWNEISMAEYNTLPLCAAENITSEFVNIPRGTFLQDKYILGGTMNYTKENNFHGSNLLFNFYELINKQCAKLFKCNYADARSFSGMSA